MLTIPLHAAKPTISTHFINHRYRNHLWGGGSEPLALSDPDA